jgi:peptidoglycan/xylan/chitin deacetylase (PgdA/CDA1 family)
MFKKISKKIKRFLRSKYFKHHRYQLLASAILVVLGLGISLYYLFSVTCSSPIALPIQISPTPTIIASNFPKVENYRVPILMYHYIRNAPPDAEGQRLSVSPTDFESQLSWLKSNNYTTIKASDLSDPDRAEISNLIGLKQKPLVLTFDDGYDDAYSAAYPLLRKYGFSGTFYIIRDDVGKPRYLTSAQIDEMRSGGMEIGSHSLNHPDLTKISPDEAHRQIFDSKGDALVFCYPSGKFNQDTKNLVKLAGYLNATTTIEGIADQSSDLFQLPRVRMSNMPLEKLKEMIK